MQARVRKKISVQGKGGGERASKNIGPYDVGDMRAGRRERVGRWRCKERAEEGPKRRSTGGGERGARGERTENIDAMLVTLDVFHPVMSALKLFW